MCSLNSSNGDDRILDWLGSDCDGLSYHLHPLNLGWSREGVEHDLSVYRRVAHQLANDADYWSAILRHANWRYTLVGCTCLLVSRHVGFFDDLCHRFDAGSMVIPQIAVTLGLLHGSGARAFFESALSRDDVNKRPRQTVSAHRVLLRLGIQPSRDVPIDAWKDFEHDDAMISEQVVQRQWDFWSSRI